MEHLVINHQKHIQYNYLASAQPWYKTNHKEKEHDCIPSSPRTRTKRAPCSFGFLRSVSRVADLALNQSQTLVSPIFRSLGTICGGWFPQRFFGDTFATLQIDQLIFILNIAFLQEVLRKVILGSWESCTKLRSVTLPPQNLYLDVLLEAGKSGQIKIFHQPMFP